MLHSVPRPLAAVLTIVALANGSVAQTPRLLADIDSRLGQPLSSTPTGMRWVGSELWFSATTFAAGAEPFRSLGSAATTQRVRDLEPGFAGTNPTGFTRIGGSVLFLTVDSLGSKIGLWRSDGTPQGTALVKDLPPPLQRVPQGLAVSGIHELPGRGAGVFTVAGTPSWVRLFRTDGTAAGTVEIAQVDAPVTDGVIVVGARVWMAGPSQFLITDGMPSGTRDFTLGSTPMPPFVSTGASLVFTTSQGLWSSDGTATGTTLLFAGAMTSGVVDVNGTLFAVAADGLVVSDGTVGGTTRVRSFAEARGPIAAAGAYTFFVANDGTTGRELWASDGTAAGTGLVRDLTPGSGHTTFRSLATVGPGVLANATLPNEGAELVVVDATTLTTQVVAIAPGPRSSSPTAFAVDPSRLRAVFSAHSPTSGTELWMSDGTAAGTALFADLASGPTPTLSSLAQPTHTMRLGARTLFFADDGTIGQELWATDGTAGGTRLVRDIFPGPAGSMASGGVGPMHVVVGGIAYFSATDGTTGIELWRSDGTNAGTRLAADLLPGPDGASPHWFVALDESRFVFAANRGLWVSDGMPAGTNRLTTELPTSLVRLGNRAFFNQFQAATGSELWQTDGTAGGTTLVVDLIPGAGSGHPLSLTVLDGSLYFWSEGLWRTDGTAAGTRRILTMPGVAPNLYAANGRLYFAGSDSQHGQEPWVSDGTTNGTLLLADLTPGTQGTFVDAFLGLRAGVVFVTDKGLWRTDGTAASTRALHAVGAWPQQAGERFAYFSSAGELLRTDGASVVPVAPGLRGDPLGVALHAVIVRADDGTTGLEPWVVDEVANVREVGTGCGDPLRVPYLVAGDPVLGSLLTLRGSNLRVGAVAAVLIGGPAARLLPIGPECAQHVDPIVTALAMNPLGGSFLTLLPVPATPRLIGAVLGAQAVAFPGGSALGLDLSNGVELALGR